LFELTFIEWLASLVAGGGVVVGIVTATVLLSRAPDRRSPGFFLGLLLLVSSAAVLQELVVNVRPSQQDWTYQFLPLQYTFSFGPLIYAYVRAKTDSKRPIRGWHFLLPVAQAGLTLVLAFLPSMAKATFMSNVYAPWYSSTEDVVFTLSMVAYLMFSRRTMRESSRDQQFEWEAQKYRWLSRLISGCVIILVVSVFFNVGGPLTYNMLGVSIYQYEWVAFLENGTYSAFLYWIAFGGFVQMIPQLERFATQSSPQSPSRQERYNVSEEMLEDYVASLREWIRSQFPHLDADLTLGKLAQQVGMTEKVLSYVLNEGLSQTYSDFINDLRVAEAQKRLHDPDLAHLSVLGIGLDSGFASKATFNRVFKKLAGVSPTQYRDQDGLNTS